MSDASGETWVEVRRYPSRHEAEQNALALVAAGMTCKISVGFGSAGLLVAPENLDAARIELDAYAHDNRSARPPPLPSRSPNAGWPGAIVYACALFFVYGAAGHDLFSRDWLSAGDAEAGLIVGGQWWRTLTALGLHGDAGHLVSNLVAGTLIGILLAQVLGGGLTWLAIVLAGALGNALSALFQSPTHAAIGASTAVFGGVGLLVVMAVRYQSALWRGGLRRWAPLGVGVMLVAFLGVEGERVDVGGHIAGFAAGCVLGLGLIALGEPSDRRGDGIEIILGVAALALFVGAWVIALVTSPPL